MCVLGGFEKSVRAASRALPCMPCVHHLDLCCVYDSFSRGSSKMADNRFSSRKEDHLLKGAMQMYVKQGLKSEEAMDFSLEGLSSISAGVKTFAPFRSL